MNWNWAWANMDLAGVLLMIAAVCCLTQKTKERMFACYVYAGVSVLHYLFFEILYALQREYAITSPWQLYYFSAAVCSVLIINLLHRLKDYTRFHEKLQWVATASIAVNGLGWLLRVLEQNPAIYTSLAYTLYVILILITRQDGRNERVCRDSGRFHIFSRSVE